jgi:ABC-type uncharacterized transport system permease subunit
MLSLGTISICHIDDDITREDIYLGKFYNYLARPYPYILAKFQQEVVWRLLSGGWALVMLAVLWGFGLPLTMSNRPEIWLLTAASLFLGMLVSFFFKVSLGLASIWLTNTKGLSDLAEIINIIMAGFIIPIHNLPGVLKTIAWWSPFASSIYFPVRILTVDVPLTELVSMLCLQVFWIVLLLFLARQTLKAGIFRYTGVGQ